MNVEQVLQTHPREVLTVLPSEAVVDVARQFEKKRAGIAMVCDDGGQLLGVVSLGDIVHAIGERGEEALRLPVRSVMTSDVATCEPGDDIETALDKMKKRNIRHMPVVENGKLRGFLQKSVALEVMFDEAALDFTQLRGYVFKTAGDY
jgi:CBS domain-containing protein